MRYSAGISVAVVVSAVAAAAPIFISVRLAWKEGLATESSLTLSYAQDALRRMNEMAQQIGTGLNQLSSAHYPPCSTPEIDLMRQIDVGSSYIQAVGRIVGNDLICNSLGSDKPIPLGSPTVVTAIGAEERLNLKLPLAGNHALDVFSTRGYAFLLDPRLPLDIPTQGPSLSMAIFVPSSPTHAIIASRSESLRPEWFKAIPKGTNVTFVSAGYVVAVTRAANIDVAVVAAAPLTYAQQRVRQFSLIFVPIGLLCAALLAWSVMRIYRAQLSLPSMLRSAARRKEFFVEYQPIVELSTGRIVGAEALVRWKQGANVVSPDAFIPAAEESGVISLITSCVTEIVAADLPAILKVSPSLYISINLSASDLRSPTTVKLIETLLRTSGASAANLKVEATEHGFLQGDESRQVLDGIRALGVGIAIDDFGTGYSSLSRLETLDLDILKIDKSFIDALDTDGATSQVVPHIINIAHSLRLVIVAEGVVSDQQVAFLRSRRVHCAQGSRFGMPMGIDSLDAALQLQDLVASSEIIS